MLTSDVEVFFLRLFSNQYHQFATKKGQNWVKYGHFNLAQNMTSFTRILTLFVVVAGIITLICYQKKVHQKASIMLRSNSYSKTSTRIRVWDVVGYVVLYMYTSADCALYIVRIVFLCFLSANWVEFFFLSKLFSRLLVLAVLAGMFYPFNFLYNIRKWN